MKKITTIIRAILSFGLIGLIWYRVDWSVALFAFLVLVRIEIGDIRIGINTG